MKKLMFTLVLMLMGTFAFASNDTSEVKEIESPYEYQLSKEMLNEGYSFSKIVIYDWTILYVVINPDGSEMGSFTISAPDDNENCNGVVFHYR